MTQTTRGRRRARPTSVGERRRVGRRREGVVAHDVVAGRAEALGHVAAHLPQPDHAELHACPSQSSRSSTSTRRRPQAALAQGRQVAGGLRLLERGEAVGAPGIGDVVGVVADHLDEHAGGRAALVELAGGVQEARAEAEGGGHAAAGRGGEPGALDAVDAPPPGST